MKKYFFVFLTLINTVFVYGQNVGIGTGNPETKLQVTGDFSVTAAYTSGNSAPTVAQTKTLLNASTASILSNDSVARIYDPGGPGGNYLGNLTANALISAASATSLEFTIETADIGIGDSLIIYSGINANDPVFLKVGNGYSATAVTYVMSESSAYVVFKSNGDATVGTGFSILFKRRYFVPTTLPQNGSIGGNSLVFIGSKGALRSGRISQQAIGDYSTALGLSPIASGAYSTAIGYEAVASSSSTVAIGRGTLASASGSMAMGYLAEAKGSYSTAIGYNTDATGDYSMAIGHFSEASGDYSTALGNSTLAKGSYALALGSQSKTDAALALATGYSTEANGYNSTTFGYNARAEGSSSVVMGVGTIGRAYTSLTIGRYNDTLVSESLGGTQSTDRAFVIGDGSSDVARSSSFYILKNGNAWMQGTLTENSDARLKTNIHKVDNALDKIKQLNGYTYNWKDSVMLPGLYTGVIAQEVQKVIPELVVPNTEGQLAVNYNGFVPYLIESIKTLEKQNENLLERIKKLEKK
ncbi:MAG: tail fiber domain-containing protein [Bacteroidota bacterium]